MSTDELFTFPWPGPGNSEGPVSPEMWVEVEAPPTSSGGGPETALLVTSPWPGPGDSEG